MSARYCGEKQLVAPSCSGVGRLASNMVCSLLRENEVFSKG